MDPLWQPNRLASGPASQFPAGQVALVGAGPGEPSAITLRAIECLQAADTVFYDYLVNPTLLHWVNPHAERISLGSHARPGKRLLTQAEVNQLIVEHARQGKRVVRLKSGDPIVFARMAEESEALRRANVPFEIVPGVTSALATGSYAGIPLTHRDASSAIALVTGHRAVSSDQSESGDATAGHPSHIDWQALAKFPGTLVVYMGTTQVEYWANELLTGGMAPEMPVAIVRRCGFTDQSTTDTTLGQLIATVTEPSRIRPPVIFVIGKVADPAMRWDWFSHRPLFQQRILITRPAHQADSMRTAMERLGAETLQWAAIETHPVTDSVELTSVVRDLEQFDWLVFSSANGVDCWMNYLWASGRDARQMAKMRIACIGQKTEARLHRYYLRADLVPQTFDADHLAEDLAQQATGKKVLLVRASRGREVLAETLQAAGASVKQVVVYQSLDSPPPDTSLVRAMEQGEINWVTVTSSAIARNLVQCFGHHLKKTKLVSISPITTSTLQELGYDVAAQAENYTTDGMIQAIAAAVQTSS